MKRQVSRRWVLAAVAVALVTLIVVAAGLSGVGLQPGQRFPRLGGEQEAEAGPPWQEPPTLERVLAVVSLILLLLTLISVILVIISRQARKDLLLRLIAMLVLLGILVVARERLEKLAMPGEPTPAAAGEAASPAVEAGPPEPVAEFDDTPPAWLVWGTKALLGLLAAAAVVGTAWLLWPRSRLPAVAAELEKLAAEAEVALEAVEAGADLKSAILHCYFEMSRVLSEARGLDRSPEMTPREFERRLVQAGLPEPPVGQLTRLFEAVRYGSKETGEAEEAQAIACLRAIVAACGGRVTMGDGRKMMVDGRWTLG